MRVPIFSYAFPLKDKDWQVHRRCWPFSSEALHGERNQEGQMEHPYQRSSVAEGLWLWCQHKTSSSPSPGWRGGGKNIWRKGISTPASTSKGTILRIGFIHSTKWQRDFENGPETIIRDAEARLELESGLRQSEKLATVR